MRTRSKTPNAMKIIALVLILASAAMLLLPWMKLSVTVDGERYSGGQILGKLAEDEGISKEEARAELRESVEELCDQAEWYGISLDANKAYSFAEKIMRGAWSPFALSSILGTVKSTADRIEPSLSMMEWMIGSSTVDTIRTAASAVGTARTVLLILLIVTLALAALAVICALTDHRLGAIPYVVFALILLLVFVLLIAAGNKSLEENFDSLNLGIPTDVLALRIGLGAILCPLLALLGFVTLFIPGDAEKTAAAPSRGPVNSWKCPNCGAVRPADQRFCLNCGTRRPEPPASRPAPGWKCPTCGAQLKPDQHFCLYCGTKRPERPAAPAPARAAAPRGWTCPGCGAKLKTSQNFCPRCGTKQPAQNGAAPVRAAAPVGWTCPGCGAKLKSEQKFCPRCGTRQPGEAAPAAPKGWTCPGCGTALREEQRFCPNCGTKRQQRQPSPAPTSPTVPLNPPSAAAPAPAPAPAAAPVSAPAEERMNVCAVCGMILAEELSFCPRCGTRVGTTIPAESYQPGQTNNDSEPAAETIPMTNFAPPTVALDPPTPAAPEQADSPDDGDQT